jgi:hypothetical protein
LVKVHWRKRWLISYVLCLHKIQRLGPSQPFCCKISQVNIFCSTTNQINNLILSYKSHFQMLCLHPPWVGNLWVEIRAE